MRDRFGERRLSDAERLGGNGHATALQGPHRETESAIDLAEHMIVADVDVELEVHASETAHAERICARRTGDARSVHRHEKRGHALTSKARARRREHNHDSRRLRVRHPHFASGDAIAAARFDGRGLLICCVGAGVGLRQRKRADRCPAREPAQPPIALLFAPGMRDELGDERIGHRQRDGDGRAGRRDRLEGERVAQVIAPGSAPSPGNRDAKEPLWCRGAHHVGGKLARLVDGGSPRRYDLARELLDRFLEGLLFRSEF